MLKKWGKYILINTKQIIKLITQPIQRASNSQQNLLMSKSVSKILNLFEPMLIKLLNETMREYNEAIPQNHFTKQAQRDIEKFYKLKIKDYINYENNI